MKNIPFLDLKIANGRVDSIARNAISKVLSSGSFINGKEVELFEEEFATYCGVDCCVGVGNGLDALTLLLRAYGVGVGDEVIVPSNTFIATWLAVSSVGAVPIPVEPDDQSYNIRVNEVSKAITPRTKAIIPVHLYGAPVDLLEIISLAKKHDIKVISDAAQAQGASIRGQSIFSLVDASATSFYPGKNLGGIGDGGAILTSNHEIAKHVRILGNYGSVKKYEHNLIGVNSRLDEVQAAYLRIKLKFLDELNQLRIDIANEYFKHLSSYKLILPQFSDELKSVWHLFVVRTDVRDQLAKFLFNNGINTMIHYPTPPHLQECYRNDYNKSLPLSETLASTSLSLPLYPDMPQEHIYRVCEKINDFFK